MPDAELMYRSVFELAELVRSQQVGARELVDVSLARIEEADAEINAFVDVDADGARAAADAVAPGDPRPFAGVPIAIKNNRGVRGLRLTLGAGLMGDYVAQTDHNVTRRLREAGFVIVGTTSMPEWGLLPVTEPRRFGPTRNPWDPGRTPGGSSGGSAAAVAAGMVPVAHGNDGGGSTRIPAACCGLVGLKPQRGRISPSPDVGQSFLVQDGVLTRTVAETAALLDLLAGPEPGDSSWAPPPPEPFSVSAAREPAGLRIGLTTAMPLAGDEIDPACAAAVQDAARLLEDLGHSVEEVQPPWTRPGLLQLFTASFGPAVATGIALAAQLAGRAPAAEDVERLSWAIWEASTSVDAVQALLSEHELQRFARKIVTWAAPYDALLTPALAEAPLPIGTLDTGGPDPLGTFARSGRFTPYTAISNVTGSPAVSVPLYERETPGGPLPLAVQLIGRPAQEGALLALAAQLEQAVPWVSRRPAPRPSPAG